MGEDIGYLVLGDIGQHGDNYTAVGGGGEEGHHPVGHILGEDGHAVPVLDPKAREAHGKLVHLAAEVLVGVLLAAVHVLVGDSFCVIGCGVVKDLVQGSARVLAGAVLTPCLVRALDFLCHKVFGF